MANFELKKEIKRILEEHPETRGDDFLLLLEVYKMYNAENYTFEYVLKEHIKLGLPSIHSIIRLRRLVQSEHEELQDKEAVTRRKEEEKQYKAYIKAIKEAN